MVYYLHISNRTATDFFLSKKLDKQAKAGFNLGSSGYRAKLNSITRDVKQVDFLAACNYYLMLRRRWVPVILDIDVKGDFILEFWEMKVWIPNTGVRWFADRLQRIP